MTWNICHAAEDAHLVRPLRRFLEISGLDCACHTQTPPGGAEGTLVLCGDSFADQSWLGQILEDQPDAIAVLIAPVNPGSQRRTIIDLRSWPSRSADKTLVAMVEWLKQGRPGHFTHATVEPSTPPKERWSNENTAIVLLMLLVLTGLGVLISMDRQTAPPVAPPLAANETARPPTGTRISRERPGTNATNPDRAEPGNSGEVSATTGTVSTREARNPEAPALSPPRCRGDFGFGCATLDCDKTTDAESRHIVGR